MIGSALAKKVRMRTRRSIGSSFADRRPSCTQSRQPKYIQHFTVPALLLLRKSEYLSLWCSSEVSNEEMHQCAKLYCVVKMRFKKIGLWMRKKSSIPGSVKITSEAESVCEGSCWGCAQNIKLVSIFHSSPVCLHFWNVFFYVCDIKKNSFVH